jgi:hypothetical protein
MAELSSVNRKAQRASRARGGHLASAATRQAPGAAIGRVAIGYCHAKAGNVTLLWNKTGFWRQGRLLVPEIPWFFACFSRFFSSGGQRRRAGLMIEHAMHSSADFRRAITHSDVDHGTWGGEGAEVIGAPHGERGRRPALDRDLVDHAISAFGAWLASDGPGRRLGKGRIVMSVDPKMVVRAQQCTDAIMKKLNDYLSIRFDQAIRINPRLKSLKQDLLYHEVESVRACLMGEKIYNVTRLVVASILMSDDEKKRRGLLSPTDQTSIQVELVSHVRESVKQGTRGQIRIHDLKSFYAAIDPTLTDMIDLLETWIWWDVYDSSELARFEQKLGVIQMVRQGRATPELRKHYGTLFASSTANASDAQHEHPEVTDAEIIAYEFHNAEHIRDQWKARREDDHGYMFVLQRDELPVSNHAETTRALVELALEHDHLDSVTELDEPTRGIYAAKLKLPADKVTRQGVVEWIRARMTDAGRELAKATDGDSHLGPPYRFKLRQLDLIDKCLRDLKVQLKDILPAEKPPAAEKPAATGAAPGGR